LTQIDFSLNKNNSYEINSASEIFKFYASINRLHKEAFEHVVSILEIDSGEKSVIQNTEKFERIFCYNIKFFGSLLIRISKVLMGTHPLLQSRHGLNPKTHWT